MLEYLVQCIAPQIRRKRKSLSFLPPIACRRIYRPPDFNAPLRHDMQAIVWNIVMLYGYHWRNRRTNVCSPRGRTSYCCRSTSDALPTPALGKATWSLRVSGRHRLEWVSCQIAWCGLPSPAESGDSRQKTNVETNVLRLTSPLISDYGHWTCDG